MVAEKCISDSKKPQVVAGWIESVFKSRTRISQYEGNGKESIRTDHAAKSEVIIQLDDCVFCD